VGCGAVAVGCGVSVGCGLSVGCRVADGGGVDVLVARGDGLVDMLVGVALEAVTTSGGTIAELVVRRDRAHAPPAPPPISTTTPTASAQRCHHGFDVAA
jgi:hypothetical protein